MHHGYDRMRAAITSHVPSNEHITSATPLKPAESLELKSWIKKQCEHAWIPVWARTPIMGWRHAYKVTDTSGDLTITILGESNRRAVENNVFPIVRSGYDVLSRLSRPQQAHIVYLPNTRNRALSLDSNTILPSNINGGMTTFASQDAIKQPWRILVIRKEDASKVMLHELVHLFALDGRQVPPDIENRWIKKYDMVKLAPPIERLGITEAVTESIACYMWAEFKCKMTGTPFCGKALDTRIFEIARLLMHGKKGRKKMKIVDGTHAFAYIIARAALWDGANGPCKELFELIDSYPRRAGCNSHLLNILDDRLPKLIRKIQRSTSAVYDTSLSIESAINTRHSRVSSRQDLRVSDNAVKTRP